MSGLTSHVREGGYSEHLRAHKVGCIVDPFILWNVGRLGGGTSINSIPFESWMEVDMRSESPEALETLSAAFFAAVESAVKEENQFRRSGSPIAVDVEQTGLRPSGEIDPSTPLVQRAMAVTREEPAIPTAGSRELLQAGMLRFRKK